jgi:GT2 family glycosyltransferase
MSVSIIIVNYNTVVLLCNAINSIIEKTKDVKYEIIVVDNNSADNSENIVSQKYGDRVTYIKLQENIGFGRANNEGAKYAKGKYLFLLNPDTILLNNAVKFLADFLEENINAGICGGNLFDNKGQAAHSYSMFLPSIMWELNIMFSYRLQKLVYGKNAQFNNTNKANKVGYITGADLMIRADLFNYLNGFDPNFFMYFEETELTYRVRKAGYKIYCIPQAKIIHLEGEAFAGKWEKRIKLTLESRRKYYKKTHKKITIKLCNCIFKIGSFSKYIIFKIAKHTQKYKYWKHILDNI